MLPEERPRLHHILAGSALTVEVTAGHGRIHAICEQRARQHARSSNAVWRRTLLVRARNPFSTKALQASLLMDVHPVPRKLLKTRNDSILAQDRTDNLLEARN